MSCKRGLWEALRAEKGMTKLIFSCYQLSKLVLLKKLKKLFLFYIGVLLLGRKAVTNLDSILKSRDITLPTEVCVVKAILFPVVMYRWESWTIKKAERRRIDAFELWCWRLLRVPWTARRSNQSILKEISPEYSLERLMLKLKLQYFGHLMRRTDSLKRPYAAEDWGREEQGTTDDEMVGWHHWLNGQELE